MKNLVKMLAGAAMFASIGLTAFAGEITVTEQPALVKDGKVAISGSGFPAGKPVILLFETKDGVVSDISYALEPAPVADKAGNWNTVWSYGRFVKKKLIGEGALTLQATDVEFVGLGKTQITFVK